MKTIRLLVFLPLIFLIACEEDVETPSVTYAETYLDAVFFQEGSSAAPSISWNGNQGNFALAPSIDGLSINSTNGIISWNNMLAPGSHDFDVAVNNSAGQVTVVMSIENVFQGTFTGTYSGTTYYQLEFQADGTLLVRANDAEDPDTASGTWMLDGSTITGDYTYDEGAWEYSISGTISQTSSEATITGMYYNGHGAEEGTEGGTIEVVLDE